MSTASQRTTSFRLLRALPLVGALALVGVFLALALAACSSGGSGDSAGSGTNSVASSTGNAVSSASASSASAASSKSDAPAAAEAAAPSDNAAFTDLSSYPAADMSSYDCAEGYTGTYRFADMTVRQIADEMSKGATMVVYAGYNHCPWCNAMLNAFNDITSARGITVAYIDTRKDPSWQNNMDIDDYDLLVELFGDAIEEDEDGTEHLYVPEIFFVKDGAMVAYHAGTVEGQSSPSDPFTQEQSEAYDKLINGYLDQLES